MPRIKLSKYHYRKLREYIDQRDVLCVNCNSLAGTPSHIISRAQGGDDSPRNMVKHCLIRNDGSEGCHRRFERGEIDLPAGTKEMLKNEPERL